VHSDCKIFQNTMAFGRRHVNVCGVPAFMCEEDLSLFFESRRFCPSGGQVENVDIDLETQTATVTFCNSEGIFFWYFTILWHFPIFTLTLHCSVTIFCVHDFSVLYIS